MSTIVQGQTERETLENAESSEAEEGLRLLLGGLSGSAISSLAWDNQSEASESSSSSSKSRPAAAEKDKNASGVAVLDNKQDSFTRCSRPRNYFSGLSNDVNDEGLLLFARAYKMSANGRLERPTVRVLDLSSEGRGNALIATERISAGEVIYTEQAVVATQLPEPTTSDDDDDEDDYGTPSTWSIRACQCCFRSLEPISSCICCCQKSVGERSSDRRFPMEHLWPIMGMEFENDGKHDEPRRRDKHGRIHCQTCDSYFCCQPCYDAFTSQLGSCCILARATRELPLRLLRSPSAASTANENTTPTSTGIEVQPAVVLAIRMFAATLQHYRTNNQTLSRMFDDLCGDASDVSSLELGVETIDDGENSSSSSTSFSRDRYSVEPVYLNLVKLWSLTLTEQTILSVDYFSSLAAEAARNGFGIRTQSPFQAYYAALLRASGDRSSERHALVKRQVAQALGSEGGTLDRGMDRIMDERVAPEIAGLFLLTARINHACGSSARAEVRQQVFVDNRIDVVSLHDIEVGEEITISYIGGSSGRHSRERRQRELRAKYLFICDCVCCQEKG